MECACQCCHVKNKEYSVVNYQQWASREILEDLLWDEIISEIKDLMSLTSMSTTERMKCCIVVINVRKKIKKTLKNAFFILKIKKTFVNVIKNVTLFFTYFWCRACWQNHWHQLNNRDIMVLHHRVWYNTKIK